MRRDVDRFVRKYPGDRLLAAGLCQTSLVCDELAGGGDQSAQGQ